MFRLQNVPLGLASAIALTGCGDMTAPPGEPSVKNALIDAISAQLEVDAYSCPGQRGVLNHHVWNYRQSGTRHIEIDDFKFQLTEVPLTELQERNGYSFIGQVRFDADSAIRWRTSNVRNLMTKEGMKFGQWDDWVSLSQVNMTITIQNGQADYQFGGALPPLYALKEVYENDRHPDDICN